MVLEYIETVPLTQAALELFGAQPFGDYGDLDGAFHPLLISIHSALDAPMLDQVVDKSDSRSLILASKPAIMNIANSS